MKCPVCPDATLLMTDRQGVEIDYCPQCRGVWLDRGELDKLLEIASKATVAYPANGNNRGHGMDRQPDFQHSDHHGAQGQYYKRKKSWLSEMFD